MTARLCANCGKPLVQREGERAGKFNARETCDVSCGVKLGHKRLVERAMRIYGIDEAELSRRAAAGLCACGKPVHIAANRSRRKTCGRRQCRGFSAAMKCDGYFDGERELQWPKVMGPIEADFSAHEITPRDGGFGFKIVRADARSYTGCSAAYTAGVA
jgi:hypothetical protein